ncbi:hypothetical protein V3C99_006292 [Haemonchus contortus]
MSASEFAVAEALLIKEHHRECETILSRMPLSRFNAHRSADGLIRCPHRVEHAYNSASSAILLVPSHPLTTLIIQYPICPNSTPGHTPLLLLFDTPTLLQPSGVPLRKSSDSASSVRRSTDYPTVIRICRVFHRREFDDQDPSRTSVWTTLDPYAIRILLPPRPKSGFP